MEIHNFKLFQQVAVELDPRITVLTGPNNSGKSTVLQAIQTGRLLLELPVTDPLAKTSLGNYQAELVARGSLEANVSYTYVVSKRDLTAAQAWYSAWWARSDQSAKAGAPERAELLPSVFKATIRITRARESEAGRCELAGIVTRTSDGRVLTVYAPGPSHRDLPRLLSSPGLLKALSAQSVTLDAGGMPEAGHVTRPPSMPPSGWSRSDWPDDQYFLRALVALFRDCLLIPAARHYPRSTSISNIDYPFITSDGQLIVPLLLHYLSTDLRTQMGPLEQSVARVIPEATSLHAMTRARPEVELRVATAHQVDAVDAYSGWQVGSGVTHVVACIAYALTRPRGSILLLEEPELGLHPRAQHRLRDELLRIASERDLQMVVTTHAGAFLNGRPTPSIRACSVKGPAGVVESIEPGQIDAARSLLGLLPSDALLADIVIVLEGATEYHFYRVLLGRDDSPLRGIQWACIDLGGVDQRTKRELSTLDQALPAEATKLLLVDGLPDVELPDLLGWTVVRWMKEGKAPGEFEDQFSREELVAALARITGARPEQIGLEMESAFKAEKRPTSRLLKKVFLRIAGEEVEWTAEVLGRALAFVLSGPGGNLHLWSHPTLTPIGESVAGGAPDVGKAQV